jgi:glucokinase
MNNNLTHISVDVGGTNTRIQTETGGHKSDIFKRVIKTKTDLYAFIGKIVKGRVFDKCVIGFAGVVEQFDKVEVTNWETDRIIYLNELISCGLPSGNTLMVNDMELAGYGLIEHYENKSCLEVLYDPEVKDSSENTRCILMAPGTGFGTSGVIIGKNHNFYDTIPSEFQHILVSPINEKHAQIIDFISAKINTKANYEDIVSGQGLENVYEALCNAVYDTKHQPLSAGEIAEKALGSSDKICIEALDIFYLYTAKLAKAAALFFRPFGGIFLCGSNNIRNFDFIKQNGFVNEFLNNRVRDQILKMIPIYLIDDEDINISGGLWACRKILK